MKKIGLVILGLVISTGLYARKWIIPDDAPTIQAGFDSASTYDTVWLKDSVYTPTTMIDFRGKKVSLMGSCPTKAIIQGGVNTGGLRSFPNTTEGWKVKNITIRGVRSDIGAIALWGHQEIVVMNCIFESCTSTINCVARGGGAIGTGWGHGMLYVYKCLFKDNHAVRGGAIAFRSASVWIHNSTFVRNTATVSGAHIYSDATHAWLYAYNSIFYYPLVSASMGGNLNRFHIRNCIVEEGNLGFATWENSFDSDPLFVNPAADSFQLQPTSPAIDKGMWDRTWGNWIWSDIEKNDRPRKLFFDIGAYEYQFPAHIKRIGRTKLGRVIIP